MNIVMLQHTFNPTTLGWVRGLESRGHRVLTIVENDLEPHGGWPDDLEVVIVPDSVGWVERLGRRLLPSRKSAVYTLPRPRDLRRAMADFDADVVVAKVYSLRNVLALLVALSLRVRRAAWIEAAAPPNLEWRILRWIGVLPRRFFTPIEERPGGVADLIELPRGGLPVITYAPVLPAERERVIEPGHPVRVLTVAAFWDPDHKRPFWTLEAARDAGLLDGRCTFAFSGLGKDPSRTGDGRKFVSQRIIQELVEELGIEQLVDVRVNVPHHEMSALYSEHDLLVLPSAWEQFGMVVPEAMAHGLAVVASDCVGSRGCIVPGVTGELFATHDRDELARTLQDLISDPARITEMGRAGRVFIEQHASPEVTAERIERLILS
jgi:glycosyltransferase involved in cell wall biosynthesis